MGYGQGRVSQFLDQHRHRGWFAPTAKLGFGLVLVVDQLINLGESPFVPGPFQLHAVNQTDRGIQWSHESDRVHRFETAKIITIGFRFGDGFDQEVSHCVDCSLNHDRSQAVKFIRCLGLARKQIFGGILFTEVKRWLVKRQKESLPKFLSTHTLDVGLNRPTRT